MSSPAYTLVKRYNFNNASILNDPTQLAIMNGNRCANAAGAFVPPVASTFTPTHGSAVQAPRIKENVTVEADGTASDGFLLRCWNREAPNGVYASYPAPWSGTNRPATAAAWHAVAPGTIQTFGGYRYRARRHVSGTGGWKGVVLLWPQSGGWSNAGANESDLEEWYNYFSGGAGTGANTNLHFKTSSGEGQFQTGNQHPNPWAGIDTTVWHTVEVQWARGFFDIWVGDGNGANMVRVVHRTDANSIPTIPMWFGVQTAMLETFYQAHNVRGNDYFDIDWLEIYSTNGNGTCPNAPVLTGSNNGGGGTTTNQPPSVPQMVQATAVSNTSVHLLWNPSTDTTGAALVGYHIYRSTSLNGTYSLIATVTNPSYVDTGLIANQQYFYQVKAFDGATPPAESDSDTQTPVTTLNTGSPPPTAVLSLTPVAGASPLTVTASLAGSSGTGITNLSLDWGDGSAVDSWANLAAVPNPYTHIYTGSTPCVAVLTVTNANGFDTDTLTVSPSIPNANATANIGLPYSTQGRPVSASQYKATLDLIDVGIAASAAQAGIYNDENQIVLSSTIKGELYPRFVWFANGTLFQGDGTYDPTTGTAILGATAPAQPAGTESFAWVVSGNTGSATTTSFALTLPNIADSGYAIAGVAVKDNTATVTTPAGWTALGSLVNGNGGNKLWLFGRTYTSGLANASVAFTTSVADASCGVILGYTNATAVDGSAVFTAGSSTSGQTTTVAQSVTPAASGEFWVTIYAARGVNNGAPLGQNLAAPSGFSQRALEGTTLGSGNQIAIMGADQLQTGTNATGTATATCSTSFTVSASVLLTHA